jgi:hypothetical protein
VRSLTGCRARGCDVARVGGHQRVELTPDPLIVGDEQVDELRDGTAMRNRVTGHGAGSFDA